MINNASIRPYQPDFEMHDVHVLWLTGRVMFSLLFDIEIELFSLQLSGENSVVASMGRRPGYP